MFEFLWKCNEKPPEPPSPKKNKIIKLYFQYIELININRSLSTFFETLLNSAAEAVIFCLPLLNLDRFFVSFHSSLLFLLFIFRFYERKLRKWLICELHAISSLAQFYVFCLFPYNNRNFGACSTFSTIFQCKFSFFFWIQPRSNIYNTQTMNGFCVFEYIFIPLVKFVSHSLCSILNL